MSCLSMPDCGRTFIWTGEDDGGDDEDDDDDSSQRQRLLALNTTTHTHRATWIWPWSASSSTTKKNSSRKSTFSTYASLQGANILTEPPPVEARCTRPRDQGHAQVPPPAARRLPQVRCLSSPLLAHSALQVQQALWFPEVLCPPSLHAARPGSLSRQHGGTASLQAVRHRRAQLPGQAQ